MQITLKVDVSRRVSRTSERVARGKISGTQGPGRTFTVSRFASLALGPRKSGFTDLRHLTADLGQPSIGVPFRFASTALAALAGTRAAAASPSATRSAMAAAITPSGGFALIEMPTPSGRVWSDVEFPDFGTRWPSPSA